MVPPVLLFAFASVDRITWLVLIHNPHLHTPSELTISDLATFPIGKSVELLRIFLSATGYRPSRNWMLIAFFCQFGVPRALSTRGPFKNSTDPACALNSTRFRGSTDGGNGKRAVQFRQHEKGGKCLAEILQTRVETAIHPGWHHCRADG